MPAMKQPQFRNIAGAARWRHCSYLNGSDLKRATLPHPTAQLIILIRDLPPEFFRQQYLPAGNNQLLTGINPAADKITVGRCRIPVYSAPAELLFGGFDVDKSLIHVPD